ncbi:DNA ligase 1 isoform X1 [Selaginella moellendorffii]|nr:DNA ligase 1 isoform X1 [Selaginella moellendorffii]|eukprot:XP_024532997.1 DNA ligase 1 isoform X1 [Selaginella moellendorffii]
MLVARSASTATLRACLQGRLFVAAAAPSIRALPSLNRLRHYTTVADVLMGAARSSAAAASNKGRAPLSSKGTREVSTSSTQQVTGEMPGVDQAMDALRSKPFDPRKAAFWEDKEPVPFLFFARVMDMISNESGRLVMTEILCNAFRTVIATTPQDLLPVVYLSANKIAPAHDGIELGIGDASIIKALADAFGRKEDQIKSQMKALGDLGLVAKASRSTQRLMFKHPPLTCAKVLETFRSIAKESGKDSQEKKRSRMKSLLVAATDCEPQYLVRLLQAKLRVGLAEATVLVALAQAAVYAEQPPVSSSMLPGRLEEAAEIMKQTYSVLPIFEKIVPILLTDGISKLPEVCAFTVGVPVGPMLAKPTKGVSEILDKFQNTVFTCEYKYDGERAQIHYFEDGRVEVYSRNAERNTGKFPDVTSSISGYMKPEVSSFVMDCEIVAYDKESNKILPFQVLSTRARKGVILSDIKVKVLIFAFDLLYLNGRVLLQEQLVRRRELLYQSFIEKPGEFQFATATNSKELEEIQSFLDDAINHSCEGLIVKTLEKDATYEPAKRSNNWLKLKKDYMDTIGDSLDLVPIGAFHGRGKRVGVYGAFLLACYDPDKEEYQSICKIGTGFTEAVLEERSNTLRKHVIDTPRPYYRYGETLAVDVWFDPVEVWEVKAADLSISPVHKAAYGELETSKGISLRFPRLLRMREDKKPEQATSSDQVVDLYRAQKINHRSTKNEDDSS